MTGEGDTRGKQQVLDMDETERGEGRGWLLLARILSAAFHPNCYPTVAFFCLLNFTFLQMLSVLFRLHILAVVYLLTFAVPYVGVYVYHLARGGHSHIVPYSINMLSYLMCFLFVWRLRMPSFMLAVLAIAVWVQCVCSVISVWWRLSIHTVASGAVIGALVVYSSLLGFNPEWWLCVVILVNGLVGSCRMILRRHTLWQVIGGTWVGIACGLIGTMFV